MPEAATQAVPQHIIGMRVKVAREGAGWKQDQLAELLGLKDRQSVSDIETGKRSLKPEELLALTDAFDRDLEFFIDPFVVAGEAKFSWRADPIVPAERLTGFEHKAGQWIGLLRWLRAQQGSHRSVLKLGLRLTIHSTFREAWQCGESLAGQLNLGAIPAECLIEKVEQKLDIPVLFVDMDEQNEEQMISGATCHLPQLGALLINRKESEWRRTYDVAHELFHALTWETMEPLHRESNKTNAGEEKAGSKFNVKIERLADNFAAGLLMPQSSLDLLIPADRRNDVALLKSAAERLRVSTGALGWRLFNLGWIDEPVRMALQSERIVSKAPHPKPFSASFVAMLHEALARGSISARKAAKTVGRDLASLKALFAEYGLSSPYDL